MLVRTTTRAEHDAVGPAQTLGVLKAAVTVGEVDNRLLQCERRFHI